MMLPPHLEAVFSVSCCGVRNGAEFSVSSSTGVRGSVAVARQLCGGGRKRKGRGWSLLALPLLREKFVVFVEKIF